ncbi:MAG: NUDIX domain-containing protein [Streptomycetaceae bacterium]|nr:NUDIX domain-containing protein [Streptomycetaceae bacterium]
MGALTPDQDLRSLVTGLLDGLEPWDALEREHIDSTRRWVDSGAPLTRVMKPDTPPMHLVSYFVMLDRAQQKVLLGEHRLAGLWLPAGGHCEEGEDPWTTTVRECREELDLEAVPSDVCGARPLFVTVTPTRGPRSHTDVSLWYVLSADAGQLPAFDEREYLSMRWLTLTGVLDEPIEAMDPHMHRFTRKLLAALRR